MKVWVVIERHLYQDRNNVAVFSTETAANNFVCDSETDDNWRVYYDVEEWEVEENKE